MVTVETRDTFQVCLASSIPPNRASQYLFLSNVFNGPETIVLIKDPLTET